MNNPGAASGKGGIPLLYPSVPYTLPGMCVYPPHPVVYPHVIPPPQPPPMCLPPHTAMTGQNLYFSGQTRVPTPAMVTSSWPYHGTPLVEGTLDYRSYMMPSVASAYQGIPYSYYMMPVPHSMPRRPTRPGTKVISIKDITHSETKDDSKPGEGKTLKSGVDKLHHNENVQSNTKESKCLKDKDEELEDRKADLQEMVSEKEELTASNEEGKHSPASLSSCASEESDKSQRITNKTVTKDHKTSTKKKKGKQKNENEAKKDNAVGDYLCEVNDKDCVPGAFQTSDQRKESLTTKGGKSSLVHLNGVITEVHCSMGKVRLQSGTEHYFSPDLCFLYGVNLAHLELWHVLIEGQQVKVTLDHTNSDLPKVTQVTVEEEDPDLDPEVTVLNIQRWCSVNCVPEEATLTLIQQVRALQ